jgi:hypothetical protein
MKKRAVAKKPAARKSAAKKQATKAVKAKPAAASKPVRAAAVPERAGAGKYTPTPIQGIGWAPFRYPL